MPNHEECWIVLEAREEDVSGSHEEGSFNSVLAAKIKLARQIVTPSRVLLMLTDHSVPHVGEECGQLPPRNVLVHPSEWGNAAAFAVWLLEIQRQDRAANFVFVPSGHCFPSPHRLRTAIRFAFGSPLPNSKVFLLPNPGLRESSATVLAPAPLLLMLYSASVPKLLEPLLEGFSGDPRCQGAKRRVIACDSVPEGDLYQNVLQANPLFLRRLHAWDDFILIPQQELGLRTVGA